MEGESAEGERGGEGRGGLDETQGSGEGVTHGAWEGELTGCILSMVGRIS